VTPEIQKLAKAVRHFLRLTSDMVVRIPGKNDTKLQRIAKYISLLEALDNHFSPKSHSKCSQRIQDLDLVSETNALVVSLFFGTRIQELFEINEQRLEGQTWIEATHPELGTAFFFPWYGDTFCNTFYKSKNFDVETLVEKMWEFHADHVHVELTGTLELVRQSSITYSSFSPVPTTLFGEAATLMPKLVDQHRNYRRDGISRTYMFYGPAGSGKTSFAMEFADRVGGKSGSSRVLRIGAESFAYIKMKDITFFMDIMEPDFIIIDDVDKAKVESSLPSILDVLVEVKTNAKRTSVLLTANNVSNFNEGFYRPGRINSWHEFGLPSQKERREVLKGYCNDSKVVLDEDIMTALLAHSEGMTGDYLRESIQRFKYESTEDVLSYLKKMRGLLKLPALHPEVKSNGMHAPSQRPQDVV